MVRTLLTAALLAAASLSAQTASFTVFGTGCASQTPSMTATGLPRLGQTFTVISRPQAGCSFGGGGSTCRWLYLMTGLSNSQIGGQPLPMLLPTTLTGGEVGCVLYTSADAIVPGTDNPFALETLVTFTVPSDPRLLGVRLYHQWLVAVQATSMTTGATRYSMRLSAAAESLIGN